MDSNLELRQQGNFVCPNCGRKHLVKDAHIRAVLIGQDSETTFRGNRYHDKITTSYLNVRFCPSCKNVRTRNKILRHISYFTIFPLLIMIIMSLINSGTFFCFTFGGFLLLDCLLFMFYVPAVKIFRELLSPALNKSIIKRAKEGNAIA